MCRYCLNLMYNFVVKTSESLINSSLTLAVFSLISPGNLTPTRLPHQFWVSGTTTSLIKTPRESERVLSSSWLYSQLLQTSTAPKQSLDLNPFNAILTGFTEIIQELENLLAGSRCHILHLWLRVLKDTQKSEALLAFSWRWVMSDVEWCLY